MRGLIRLHEIEWLRLLKMILITFLPSIRASYRQKTTLTTACITGNQATDLKLFTCTLWYVYIIFQACTVMVTCLRFLGPQPWYCVLECNRNISAPSRSLGVDSGSNVIIVTLCHLFLSRLIFFETLPLIPITALHSRALRPCLVTTSLHKRPCTFLEILNFRSPNF